MKICVLSNSHAASLKQGWDRLAAQYPGVQLTFFASRALGMRGLQLRGRALVPSDPALAKDLAFTSGGHETIELAGYDVFLGYGLDLRMPVLGKRLSAAVKFHACQDALNRSLNLQLCRMVREGTRAPVFIGPNPQHSLRQENEGKPWPYCGYEEVLRPMAANLDALGLKLAPQPRHTLGNGWNTKATYATGSIRLDVGDQFSNQAHPSDDLEHMNGEFGRLYLVDFFGTLAIPKKAF